MTTPPLPVEAPEQGTPRDEHAEDVAFIEQVEQLVEKHLYHPENEPISATIKIPVHYVERLLSFAQRFAALQSPSPPIRRGRAEMHRGIGAGD
jgi:hypothetical protein